MVEGLGQDALLVAADIDPIVGKAFRQPTVAERDAAQAATASLSNEADFAHGMPAVPNETIPTGNNHTVRPSLYGAKTYGQLCNDRQTLGSVRLARVINDLGAELVTNHAVSEEYAAAQPATPPLSS